MTTSTAPLVSVVIPVYNGEEFIADAIRSVLAQTHQHFDLTVVNNCSKDHTRDVVLSFAERDARIRLHDNTEFLNVVANHNKAFTVISPEAKYVKILGADDWFFPHCLEELVKVAEAYPSVGMVTSYVLQGARIGWAGLPYPSTFIDGRAVCRLRLLEGIRVFGGPSASLIRADIVRQKQPFYNPKNFYGDTEAYLDLLQDHDLGFVHQVLSYNRRGEKSRTTSYLDRVSSSIAADVHEIQTFGPVYLTPDEFARQKRKVEHEYYKFLGAAVFELKGKEFWHYHLVVAREFGVKVNRARLALYTLERVVDVTLNPLRTIKGIIRRMAHLMRAEPKPEAPRGAGPAAMVTPVPSAAMPPAPAATGSGAHGA